MLPIRAAAASSLPPPSQSAAVGGKGAAVPRKLPKERFAAATGVVGAKKVRGVCVYVCTRVCVCVCV